MECPKCSQETEKVIAGSSGLFCPSCGNTEKPSFGWTKVMAGNKYDRKMSYADTMHIRTRRLSPDGKSVIKNPKWS